MKLLERAQENQVGFPPPCRRPTSTPSRPAASPGSPVIPLWRSGYAVTPLERGGDGGKGNHRAEGIGPLALRLVCGLYGVASTISSAARRRTAVTRSSSRATPRPGSTPGPSSRAAERGAARPLRMELPGSKPVAGLSSYPHPRLMPDFWSSHRVHGHRPPQCHLPGPLQQVLHNRA